MSQTAFFTQTCEKSISQVTSMSEIGSRLKLERKRLKLSGEEFAQLVGVSPNSQYNYEKGVRAPDTDYLLRTAEHGVDVFFVLTGERATGILVVEEAELLLHYRKAPPALQSAALAVLKAGSQPGGITQTIHGNVGQQIKAEQPGQSFTVHMGKAKKKSRD